MEIDNAILKAHQREETIIMVMRPAQYKDPKAEIHGANTSILQESYELKATLASIVILTNDNGESYCCKGDTYLNGVLLVDGDKLYKRMKDHE